MYNGIESENGTFTVTYIYILSRACKSSLFLMPGQEMPCTCHGYHLSPGPSFSLCILVDVISHAASPACGLLVLVYYHDLVS